MNRKFFGGGLPKFAAVLCFWLVLWQAAAYFVGVDFLLPSPIDVVKCFLRLAGTAVFRQSIGFTAGRIFIGFFTAFLVALGLAVLSGLFRTVRELLYPFMTAVKSVPVASFVILALIWVGSASLSIFISFVMVLPVLYTGMLSGIDARDEKMLEMADSFGLSPLRKAVYIYLPTAFPYVRNAVCVSLGLCWKAGVAAELIGVPHGSIGEQLYFSKAYFLTAELFAWTLTIIVLSMVFEKMILLAVDKAFLLFESA